MLLLRGLVQPAECRHTLTLVLHNPPALGIIGASPELIPCVCTTLGCVKDHFATALGAARRLLCQCLRGGCLRLNASWRSGGCSQTGLQHCSDFCCVVGTFGLKMNKRQVGRVEHPIRELISLTAISTLMALSNSMPTRGFIVVESHNRKSTCLRTILLVYVL